MNRRNNSGGIASLIVFLVFMSLIAGPLTGFVFGLIPLVVGGVIFFQILAGAFKSNDKDKTSYTRRTNKSAENTNLSLNNKNLINKKLAEYFKEAYELPIFNDIKLITKSGNFTSYNDLYIAKNSDVILTLKEFGDAYPSTYRKICDLLLTFAKTNPEVMKAEVKIQEVKKAEKLSNANKYIKVIDELNVMIPQEEISSGLDQTCSLLKQIDLASKNIENDNKLEKLYDYYLPILVNILNNYKNLNDAGVTGKEFKDCESQLIKTIILINEALKTINETIHETDYMNLSADITTLQSLLKKDGLVKEGTIYRESEDQDE